MSEEKKDDKRCFVIMPISDQGDYPKGHFSKVYEQIFKPAIINAGFEPYRVDEDKICDSIINKIFEAVQHCPMALCDLSNRNPNVLYELGLRQAYDKPVVLVQDDKTERIFDVSGINTVGYRSARLYEDVIEAQEAISSAIKATRDGKENSVVKIIKAGIADTISGDISDEDKVTIMLNSIMRDIQELKNEKKNSGFSKHVREIMLEPALYKMNFKINLKQGITNKHIHEHIDRLNSIWDCDIDYFREGDLLIGEVSSDSYNHSVMIIEQLKNFLQYEKNVFD